MSMTSILLQDQRLKAQCIAEDKAFKVCFSLIATCKHLNGMGKARP